MQTIFQKYRSKSLRTNYYCLCKQSSNLDKTVSSGAIFCGFLEVEKYSNSGTQLLMACSTPLNVLDWETNVPLLLKLTDKGPNDHSFIEKTLIF